MILNLKKKRFHKILNLQLLGSVQAHRSLTSIM